MILYADDQLPACYLVGRRADVRELQELISTGVRRRASGGFAPRVPTGYYYRAGLAPYVESSASIWSATAAPPASATPARSPSESAW